MGFKKIIPRSRTLSGSIRVSFSGSKTIYANIYFPDKLLNEIGWELNCRVFVYFDDDNPKRWMIEKALDSDKDTFKIVQTKEGKSGTSKLQFKFSECEISEDQRKLKAVNYEIKSGAIIIAN